MEELNVNLDAIFSEVHDGNGSNYYQTAGCLQAIDRLGVDLEGERLSESFEMTSADCHLARNGAAAFVR